MDLRFVRPQSELKNTLLGIAEAYTCDPHGALSSEFGHEDPITIKVRCQLNQDSANLPAGLTLTLAVCDALGRRIFTTQRPLSIPREDVSALLATVRVPGRFLAPGHYTFIVNVNVPPSKIIDRVEEVCRFAITDAGSEFAIYEGRDYGCVFANCDWAMEFQPLET
jgi:lipopolysaccharide transport system ATP-binding protein